MSEDKQVSEKSKKQDIWSLNDLKKASADDIFDRIEQIEYQSFSYQCRLWYALRKTFKTTNDYGDYIKRLLEDPYRAECVPSQSTRSNMIRAGAFMEQHKIGDLNQAKIRRDAIYCLAYPDNKAVAEKILREIRGKNTPPSVVRKMIDEAKADLIALEEQSIVADIEREPTGIVRTVQVVDNVAIEHDVVVDADIIEPVVDQSDHVDEPQAEIMQTEPIAIEPSKNNHIKQSVMQFDCSEYTDDEAAELLVNIASSLFKRPLLGLLKVALRKITEAMYPKR